MILRYREIQVANVHVSFPGGYYCECVPGYRGNGRECVDMDECFEGTHLCSPTANCTNTIGGYTCECLPGFYGDGFICQSKYTMAFYTRGNKLMSLRFVHICQLSSAIVRC